MRHIRDIHEIIYVWYNTILTYWNADHATSAGWTKHIWKIHCILKSYTNNLHYTEKGDIWKSPGRFVIMEVPHRYIKGLGVLTWPLCWVCFQQKYKRIAMHQLMPRGWLQDTSHGPQAGWQHYLYAKQNMWKVGTTRCYPVHSTWLPGNDNRFFNIK